jgi:hypothetical protein
VPYLEQDNVARGDGGAKVAPVSGRVTLNGRPIPNAVVLFMPVGDGKPEAGPSSLGLTDAAGNYTLTLTAPEKAKGALVGTHKVLITLAEEKPDPDRPQPVKRLLPEPVKRLLPARYGSKETTPLEFRTPPTGTDSANFELKTP